MSHVKDVARLMRSFGEDVSDDWKGVDAVYPLIDMIMNEGGVFMVKVDGERAAKDDTGMFTVMISKGRLEEGEAIRVDSKVLEEALSYVLVKYAQIGWSWK